MCMGLTYIRNTLSRERMMSRAFVKEDADEPEPRFVLPKRDHPSFDEAAAWALIEGANAGNSRSAELATGYKWGEPRLVLHIEAILGRAREEQDERTEELAEPFLLRVRRERAGNSEQ